MTALSCWRRLPVIALNSARLCRERVGDSVAAAQQLGARYRLQGSVRRVGGKIRISAQLVDASSRTKIWTRQYDRDLGNMFAVQDDITARIAQSIEPQLSRRELQRALLKHRANLDSWDYTHCALSCLYGASSHVHSFAGADAAEARRLLEKAIELDPASSYPHSLTALSHFHDALADRTKDRRGPRPRHCTLRAVRFELDDDDWPSHALLGIAILWTSRNHYRALEEVERAIARNPSARDRIPVPGVRGPLCRACGAGGAGPGDRLAPGPPVPVAVFDTGRPGSVRACCSVTSTVRLPLQQMQSPGSQRTSAPIIGWLPRSATLLSASDAIGRAGQTPALCSQTFPKRMSAPPIRFGSPNTWRCSTKGFGGQAGPVPSVRRSGDALRRGGAAGINVLGMLVAGRLPAR